MDIFSTPSYSFPVVIQILVPLGGLSRWPKRWEIWPRNKSQPSVKPPNISYGDGALLEYMGKIIGESIGGQINHSV